MRTILPEDKNPALRAIAKDIPVGDIRSAKIKKLIAEMKSLLANEEYGVALAAPQVGEGVRLFVISGRALARGSRNAKDEKSDAEVTGDEVRPHRKLETVLPDQVYINPTLVKISRAKKDKHEGCLSIRGKWGEVPRADKATIRAYDEAGHLFTRGASGFLAHIFQHEIDHLNGILYTDKATKIYEEKDGK